MPPSLNQPAVLLVLTGSFLGLTFPFGKLASQAGVAPPVWAFVISAGAALPLLVVQRARGKAVSTRSSYLRFYLLAALVSLVLPNLLIFIVIPHLGSGFTGLLFTLSPIFTLVFASLARLEWPGKLALAGILTGFSGAVIVALTRGEVGQPASLVWILIGLGMPMSLAIGNVYRTLAWPRDASAVGLAAGTNLAAASVLLLVVLQQVGPRAFLPLLDIPWLVLAQIVVATCLYACHFRLQRTGGPLYLSQISYVAAAIALFIGTLFLSERYSWVTWVGAVVIMTGIGCGVFSQLRARRALPDQTLRVR